jgi:hypothetical protein
MNKGIEKATGDIVGIINSDDWYETDAVEKIVNCFKASEAELVYGKIRTIYPDGTRQCSEKVPINKIWSHMVIPHPSVFVKREVYERYGKFSTRYDIAADYELLLRFYSEKVRFEYIDEIIANFLYGGISTTNVRKCAYESWRVSLSHINKCPNNSMGKILNEINNSYILRLFKIKIDENPWSMCTIIKLLFDDKENGIVIWGTGIWGKRCYAIMQKYNIPVNVFVDNNSKVWGQNINGVVICKPEVLIESNANVFVAVAQNGSEIEKQLISYENPDLKWVTLDELSLLSFVMDKNMI